jgi:hypothetical protein
VEQVCLLPFACAFSRLRQDTPALPQAKPQANDFYALPRTTGIYLVAGLCNLLGS